jgi:tetratricopeptide (TPR) repeat protein
MSDEISREESDRALDEMVEQVSRMRAEGRHQTGMRLGREARRQAEAAQRLMNYLDVNFEIMNFAQHLLDPQTGRDAAVRCVALLESQDRARIFQADYSEQEYQRRVYWLSSCSYDNIAVAAGMLNGYNSAGMQSCIADGIRVCRRTGKTECIACFNEYATEVFRAADDLEMALHHARANATRTPTRPSNDRRFAGAWDEAELLLLQGQLAPAMAACKRAAALIEKYHSKIHATRKTRALMNTLHLLMGVENQTDVLLPEFGGSPAGEDVEGELREALYGAAVNSVAKNHPAAIETLTRWDQTLTRQKCITWWFEVRLRLIAAHLLAGEKDRAVSLAESLRDRATVADDFLTLRRLALLLSGSVPVSPVPVTGGFELGPFAGSVRRESAAANASAAALGSASATGSAESSSSPSNQSEGSTGANESKAAPAASAPAPTPLAATVKSIGDALFPQPAEGQTEAPQPDYPAVLAMILAIDPKSITDQFDAFNLLYFATRVAWDSSSDARLWDWAREAAHQFASAATAVSLLADVGYRLTTRKENPLSQPAKEEIEKLYRESLSMAPENFDVFARAGLYFLHSGNQPEGERCLARAFRLNRAVETVAQELAGIYARTDRRVDALAVRDMAIREGVESPAILWSAALDAMALERDRAAISYLDRYEKNYPNHPWIQYHKACAHLKLSQPEQAMAAIEAEAPRVKETFQIDNVRALAAAMLNDSEKAAHAIDAALAVRLAGVTALSPSGIASGLARLLQAATLLKDEPRRQAVEHRLHETGLFPQGYCQAIRERNEKTKGLTHYECTIHQPLDESWKDSPGCLADRLDWKSYKVILGVLAGSEEEATTRALQWQAQGSKLPAKVESLNPTGTGYDDHPGVTWYARREGDASQR